MKEEKDPGRSNSEKRSVILQGKRPPKVIERQKGSVGGVARERGSPLARKPKETVSYHLRRTSKRDRCHEDDVKKAGKKTLPPRKKAFLVFRKKPSKIKKNENPGETRLTLIKEVKSRSRMSHPGGGYAEEPGKRRAP